MKKIIFTIWVFVFCLSLLLFSCKKKICDPGRQRCSTDRTELQICSKDGEWKKDKTCIYSGKTGEVIRCGECIFLKDGKCFNPGVQECSEGFVFDSCGCSPVLPSSCPPGSFPVLGGTCEPAGPQECAEGFKLRDEGGCEPVLDACREDEIPMLGGGCVKVGDVDSCGQGDFGDIPDEKGTVHVNPGYEGNDADGTREKPYKDITAAYEKAKKGGTIALAAGLYSVYPRIEKSVTLIGRCAQLVLLKGMVPDIYGSLAGLTIQNTHDVTVEGVTVNSKKTMGILVSNSDHIVLKNLKVTGSVSVGIHVKDAESVTVRRCIVENTAEIDGDFGYGINFEGNANGTLEGDHLAEENLVIKNHRRGIRIGYTNGTVRNNMVADTEESTKNHEAAGIGVDESYDAVVQGNIVTGSAYAGIHCYGTSGWDKRYFTILRNVVKDTKPIVIEETDTNNKTVKRKTCFSIIAENPGTAGGIEVSENYISSSECYGIAIIKGENFSMSGNTMIGASGFGAVMAGSTGIIENNFIKKVMFNKDLNGAVGIAASEFGEENPLPLNIAIIRNRVLEVEGSAVSTRKYEGTISHNWISDLVSDQLYGSGVTTVYAKNLSISENLLEKNNGFSLWFSHSSGTIKKNIIRDTVSGSILDEQGNEFFYGTAIMLFKSHDFTVTGNFMENSTYAAVIMMKSTGEINGNVIVRTVPGPDRKFGFGILGIGEPRFNSMSVIGNNTITQASAAGIFLISTDGVVRENLIRETKPGKVEYEGGTTGLTEDGIQIQGAKADVIANLITDNKRFGMSILAAEGSLQDNIFIGSNIGIGYENDSILELVDNECYQMSICVQEEKGLPVQKMEMKFPEVEE
jgi:hypothetical protein